MLAYMHNRMGDDVRPDLAISLEVMGTMLRFMDLDYSEAIGKEEKSKITIFAMFSIASYLGGLRDEEILKLDLFGVNSYFWMEIVVFHLCTHDIDWEAQR